MKDQATKKQVQALTKYRRMSPIKMRQVAKEIQGMSANSALELLQFIPRKSARLIEQTLKSAIANAENNHDMASADLVIKSAIIEEGPAFKRYQPTARGMAHPRRKRTSHIRIILH